MLQSGKKISTAIIRPSSCQERLIPLRHESASPLQDRDIQAGGISILDAPYHLGRSNLEEHVLIYTLEGEARFETMTSEGKYRLGDLWISPAHKPYRHWVEKRWKLLWFVVNSTPYWSCIDSTEAYTIPSLFLPRLELAMEGFLSEILDDTPESRKSALHFAEAIGLCLDRELGTLSEPPSARRIRGLLHDLWREVDSRLNHPWKISEMAAQVHVTPGHFRRLVTKHYNCSPTEMLFKMRMRQAERLLLHGGYPIYIISEMLSYANPYAFSKAFKRHTGVSPRGYEKSVKATRTHTDSLRS